MLCVCGGGGGKFRLMEQEERRLTPTDAGIFFGYRMDLLIFIFCTKTEIVRFIKLLRGISLIGIDSAESDINFKKKIWELFSNEWSLNLGDFSKIISIIDIDEEIAKILEGKQVGRVVITPGKPPRFVPHLKRICK